MNDEELLQQQVVMSTSSSLGQSVWVYRGSMWAYPWYTSVRKTLEDPAYADWYVPFKPVGPWYSDKCDHNYSPPLCSNLYHNQGVCAQMFAPHPFLATLPSLSLSPSLPSLHLLTRAISRLPQRGWQLPGA